MTDGSGSPDHSRVASSSPEQLPVVVSSLEHILTTCGPVLQVDIHKVFSHGPRLKMTAEVVPIGYTPIHTPATLVLMALFGITMSLSVIIEHK